VGVPTKTIEFAGLIGQTVALGAVRFTGCGNGVECISYLNGSDERKFNETCKEAAIPASVSKRL
jgi:hypothetical protein